MISSRIIAVLFVVMGLFACKRGEPQMASAPSADTIHVGVVDSVFTVEEEIRRFKAARGNPAAVEMTKASLSRDALVERFARALEKRDTAELRAMVLSAAEFIDLYYPSSMYVKPPYKQSPELVWFLMQESGEKGIKRALTRYGGSRASKYEGYDCAGMPVTRDANRFYGECVVRWTNSLDKSNPIRLFGPVMERNGRFKFVSYSNDL